MVLEQYIVILLIIFAGISNAIMDTLQFKFHESIFRKLNHKIWNPETSWRNKWKGGIKDNGERFWGSSRWFVRFTDAWHFFQGMLWTFLFGAIVLYKTHFNIIIDFIIIYFVFCSIFYVFHRYIFKLKFIKKVKKFLLN